MHTRNVKARRVGRYEVLGEVGRGGMSIVHRARHVDLGRIVALKELSAFHAAQPGAAERFVRESQLAGALSHPNVVTVHDYFEFDGTPFIAMELLVHGSLRPLVRSLTLAQTLGVIADVLAALTRAERAGIVHRDLKPENLLLSDDGRVKITDFGIAKARTAGREGAFATMPGTTVGTPEYMAPEQAVGGEIGPWTDLYAVGTVAYELLAGHVPFPARDGEEPVALLLRQASEDVPPLTGVDAGLAAWVAHLLEKDGRDRPPSAGEAARELEELALGLVGPRWRANAALPVGEVLAEPGGGAAVVTVIEPDGLRSRRWAAAAVAAAVAAGALAGVATGGGRTPQRGAAPALLRGASASLQVPAGWHRARAEIAGATAARGTRGERVETLVVDGHGPSLLPTGLRQPQTSAAVRERLGALDVQRFRSEGSTTWAAPLATGVLVIRCTPASDACARAAATARPLSGGTPQPPAASDAYGARLRGALRPLLRAAGSAAQARTATARANGARALASAAAASLTRLGAAAPSAWEAAAHGQTRTALRRLRDAARAVASAARSTSRTHVRSTERRLDGALRRLRAARAALAALGYR
jgi:hypothetical protein